MQFEDIKLNKIYQVLNGNNYNIGILIPLYIENRTLCVYTIQTVGSNIWIFDDKWEARESDSIYEFRNGEFKTEDKKVVNRKFIINAIFTAKLN